MHYEIICKMELMMNLIGEFTYNCLIAENLLNRNIVVARAVIESLEVDRTGEVQNNLKKLIGVDFLCNQYALEEVIDIVRKNEGKLYWHILLNQVLVFTVDPDIITILKLIRT